MVVLLLLGCAEPVAPSPETGAAGLAVASLPAPLLLRRLSLDLRGTLPSLAELDAVEADVGALAMLIGAGVRGGQVIGAYDDDFVGRPVDLVSGETVESGTRLGPGNLGATLLQLGGIDPAIHIGDATAIEAAIL